MIRAYYWEQSNNFGDMLSPIVLRWVSGQEVEWTDWVTQGKVLAIGSILWTLQPNDVVWGAGLIQEEEMIPPEGVEFLAVRGPLTRRMIRADIPEIYGDPALLLPKFYRPHCIGKYDVGIIPHEVDKEIMKIDGKGILSIDINGDTLGIVDRICSCDRIISSSLHGIVVAEAYGIPAVWVKASDNIHIGVFKFNDYFLSTGRDYQEPVVWDGKIERLLYAQLPAPHIDTTGLEKAFRERFK